MEKVFIIGHEPDAFKLMDVENGLIEKGFKIMNPTHSSNLFRRIFSCKRKELANRIYTIHTADKIALLPMWNEEIQSRLYLAFSIASNIPIIDANTLKPIKLNLQFNIAYDGSNY